MRKVLIALILGVVTLTVAACGSQDEQGPIDDGVLTVGMECAYAPYNWTTVEKESDTAVKIDGQNQYCDGYDVKIAQLIADELGVELSVKALDWSGIIPALTSNEIDVIIAGMSPTEDRKQTIAFSDPYFRSEEVQVVVVDSDSAFTNATSITDFAGAAISAQKDTLQERLIEQMTGVLTQDPKKDYPTLVGAVDAGEIDGFIAELPVAQQQASTNSFLTIIQFESGNGFTLADADVASSVGLRKEDTELRDEINRILAGISDETRNEWMNSFVNLSSN
ncbi:transporter substrate-binding domain-containing protein [Haloplasma contractile]|uniref:Amino acid ABC transporter amino acid-binding-permease protein n=1 Tax=Haloplasma contractile SSD-17B TaxID=1033810 RepID=U2FGM4_9MOLU|nr:transporter substrate-binding domain-containing protein [Haloplasma contractile]ERJ12005.1 Amino acid ABC transporter amino acid-binding-permease protein [Haloplasma contractile SSD-17B]